MHADGSVEQGWPAASALNELFEERRVPAILSIWAAQASDPPSSLERSLLTSGWSEPFEQTAMVKALNAVEPFEAPHSPLIVSPVEDEGELATWAALSGAAFGYEIDVSALKPLLGQAQVSVLKAVQDDAMVATALLLRTGLTAGLHQMSVDPGRQKQGIASALMAELERRAQVSGAQQMVLQASPAGLPLYAKRGFVPQMTLRNYLRLP